MSTDRSEATASDPPQYRPPSIADDRPESPRHLDSAWRDAGYRQAVLDVYESIITIVQARGLVREGSTSDGSPA